MNVCEELSISPKDHLSNNYNKETGYVRVANNETLEVGKGYWILLEEVKEFFLTCQPIN